MRKINKKFVLLLCLILLLSVAAGVTLALLYAQADPYTNTFVSGLDDMGELTITKQIVNTAAGSDWTIPETARENTQFTFTVDLGTDCAGKTYKDTKDNSYTANENGVLTVHVYGGAANSVTLCQLPVGREITVTEQPGGAGFTPENGTQTATLAKNQVTELVFRNTYTPTSVSFLSGIGVEGTKVIDGRDWQDGDSFDFLLMYKAPGDEAYSYVNQDAAHSTVNLTYIAADHDEPDKGEEPFDPTFSFNEILSTADFRFSKLGTYSFKVTEVRPADAIEGMYYDAKEYNFTVTVTDDTMDGALEIASVQTTQSYVTVQEVESRQYEVTFTVTNSFNYVELPVSIQKTVKDEKGGVSALRGPEGFTFELLRAGETTPVTATTDVSGKAQFYLTFTRDDIGSSIRYTLKEQNAGQTIAGVTYDDEEYVIQIDITGETVDGVSQITGWTVSRVTTEEVEGQTKETVTALYQKGQTAASEPGAAGETPVLPETYDFAFENIYDPADAAVTVSGVKNFSGHENTTASFPFTFRLYRVNADGSRTDTGASATVNMTAADSSANFTLSTTIDTTGEFTFEVEEEVPAQPGGVRYDPITTRRFSVKVVDENGVLTPYMDGAAAGTYEVSYTNTYSVETKTIRFEGTKQYLDEDGSVRTLTSDDLFTFELWKTDEAFEPVSKADSVKNSLEGKFILQDSCRGAGTYYYLVKEAAGTIAKVDYDETVYYITVTVTDNGDGTLSAASVIATAKDGTGVAEEILFTNRYAPGNASIAISGTKKLVGADLAEGKFSFLLYETGSDFNITGAKKHTPVTNERDGSFCFTDSKPTGTYYYALMEDSSAKIPGIDYDESVYHITAVVADGNASLTVSKDGQAVENIVFTNTLVEGAAVPVSIQKTVVNTGTETIGNDGFNFLLKNMDTGETYTTEKATDSKGSASITIPFTLEDAGKTYTFNLSEIDDNRQNVTYDTTVYKFQISVSLSEDGKLMTAAIVDGKTMDALTFGFRNTYDYSVEKPTEPETTAPETTAPETAAPETTVPETTVPETTAPDAQTPPTGDPGDPQRRNDRCAAGHQVPRHEEITPETSLH